MQGNENGGVKTKIRKQSRRKTADKEGIKKRIQRWNTTADAWKRIINNNKLVLAAKTRTKIKRANKNVI